MLALLDTMQSIAADARPYLGWLDAILTPAIAFAAGGAWIEIRNVKEDVKELRDELRRRG